MKIYIIILGLIMILLTPTVSNVFAHAGTPVMIFAVWDDEDNNNEVLSVGDTLTIRFDHSTNRPGGTETLAKEIVDNLFTFSNNIGTDYTGIWTSTTVFTITIVDATGATSSVGDLVSAKGTLAFTGTLDTTGGTDFVEPHGVTSNSTDYIFVEDRTNGNVQIFNPDGTYSGVNLSGFTFGASPDTIRDIHTNSTDFILVSEGNENKIMIFNPDGTYSGVNSTGGTISNPYGIATNSTNHIFLADASLSTVIIFNPSGSFQKTVSGVVFDNPQGVAINSTNFIFVADRDLNAVRIFNPDGTYSADLSGGTFNDARGVAINSTDFVFVSDTDQNNVQIFNPSGAFVTTLDTTGGTTFDTPLLLHVDNNDRVFVPDDTLNSVQIFSQGIRDFGSTVSPSSGGVFTIGDFGVVPTCTPSITGSWTIISTCKLETSLIFSENISIENSSVLIIPAGLVLDVDFSTKNITITSDSGILIQNSGKIL